LPPSSKPLKNDHFRVFKPQKSGFLRKKTVKNRGKYPKTVKNDQCRVFFFGVLVTKQLKKWSKSLQFGLLESFKGLVKPLARTTVWTYG